MWFCVCICMYFFPSRCLQFFYILYSASFHFYVNCVIYDCKYALIWHLNDDNLALIIHICYSSSWCTPLLWTVMSLIMLQFPEGDKTWSLSFDQVSPHATSREKKFRWFNDSHTKTTQLNLHSYFQWKFVIENWSALFFNIRNFG